jgi:hypothetical protein
MKRVSKMKMAKVILLTTCLLVAAPSAYCQSAFAKVTADASTNSSSVPAQAPAPSTAAAGTTPAPPASSTNTPSIVAPLQTAEQWLTSFSSNSWSRTHGYIETGAAYQNQVQFADALELGFNVLSTGTNSGLTLSDNLLTASIAGTIVSDSLDVAWRFDVKDVQIQFGAGPGFDKANDRLFADMMGELQKKMSANTHAYLRLDLPYEGKKSGLEVIIGLGGEF